MTWRIKLDNGTIPGWRFATERDALDKIEDARRTMHPKRIDPRWVSPEVFHR